jgi:hypothetical protein
MDDETAMQRTHAKGVLVFLDHSYPIILLFYFLIFFLVHSVLSAPKEEYEEAETKLGPGGRPLPKNKKKTARLPELPDFGPRKKALFNWLSLGLLFTFVADTALVVVHAIAKREENWWCGQHAAVSPPNPCPWLSHG